MLLIIILILFILFLKYIRNPSVLEFPDGILFFYSMENCPHCILMDHQLELLQEEFNDIKVFKITLKSDSSLEYSEDSENLKNYSKRKVVTAYPTFIFRNKIHLGSMNKDELLNFFK